MLEPHSFFDTQLAVICSFIPDVTGTS